MITERKILRFDSREFPLSSFIKNEGVVPKSSRYDRSFLVKSNSKKYKETRLGDFIYSSNNLDTGSIGLNNYGNAVISPVYSVFTSKDTENLETSFINLLFKKNFYKNKMLRFRQGVTYGQWKIKENDFLNLKVYTSNSIEIEKIIAIFSKISQCIALYERKLKLLSQAKKYFLDNLFAEKEYPYPNLRFKGYEDTWLKSKFSKFLSIPEKEKVTIDSPSRILTVKLNLGGVQKGANRTTLKLNSTTYYLRKAGQLIYGKQNLFNGSLAIIPPQFEGYVTSGDVPSLNIDNINKQFLYYYIARKSFYEKTEAYSSGTGSKRIHEKTFLSFNIVYPENLKEQEKISRLISSINSNIKLYCSKKNKLTAIKKKLLNTMFI